ncbi:hypothetical protein [Methanobrevibacter sp.]|uniref:hypothetical protein n=1 Tax=Methanobrevibacter sp. TaxID=66852 RepID=UPI0038659C18
MKQVNLKKETKKARKAQEKADLDLQSVIEAVELKISADNVLLTALKKMQDPLNILMDDANGFEEKAKAYQSLSKNFSILRQIMEVSWAHGNDYGTKYDSYDDSMYELINLGIVNAVDEKSADNCNLGFFETPEELYETLTNYAGDIKFIDDL